MSQFDEAAATYEDFSDGPFRRLLEYWGAATLEKASAESGFGPVRRQSHRLSSGGAAEPADF